MQSDGMQSDESEGLIVFTCSLCMQSDESEGLIIFSCLLCMQSDESEGLIVFTRRVKDSKVK